MAIVTLNDIHVAFGPEVVLDKLDLVLHPGEKVGMVGANGTGKSTILKLITDQITPDMGRVIKQKGLRIGYLRQEATFSGDRTVMEEMHAGVDHLLQLQRSIHDVSAEMENLSGSALQGKRIRLPIGGTLERPEIDQRVFEQLRKQFVRETIQDMAREVLEKEVSKQLERLFGLPPGEDP